jgi:hypothetical protein
MWPGAARVRRWARCAPWHGLAWPGYVCWRLAVDGLRARVKPSPGDTRPPLRLVRALAVIQPAAEERVQRLAERGHGEDDTSRLDLPCRLPKFAQHEAPFASLQTTEHGEG